MDIKKIFFSFIFVLIFSFFIFNSTYFDNKVSYKNINQINFGTGIEELTNSGKIALKKIDNLKDISKDKIYVENINFSDKVYFLGNQYSKSESQNQTTINISKGGLYFFDLYDITSNYKILSEGIKITPLSPGRIYIDNRDNQKISIFSFDGIFSLSLLDNNKEVSNLSLFPKMFFGFNTSRNKFLGNADLLRIESVSNISYVKENIINEKGIINYLFLRKIVGKINDDSVEFIKNIISHLYNNDNILQNNLSNIELLDDSELSGIYYIDKYFSFFLNDEKKKIYYKKTIIRELNKLINGENVEKQFLLENLALLKQIDETEFSKFEVVLFYYYDKLLKINSVDFIDKSFLLSEVISKSHNEQKTNLLKSYFYLNKVYSLINSNIEKNTYIQLNLYNFLLMYLKENQIKIDEKFIVTIKNKNELGKVEYLNFFIKNVLNNNLDLSNSKKLINIMYILKIYDNINLGINNFNKDKNAEALVLQNYILLEKFLYEIRNNFFNKELNGDGLLVLNEENNFDTNSLKILNDVINSFYTFLNSKKNYLSDKNKFIEANYLSKIVIYKELYDALNNYQEYLINYNKVTSDLLSTKTIAESSQSITLSKENLVKYLGIFEGIDIQSLQFQIVNDHYVVDNIYLNGDKIGFNLYPKEYNRIDNITKNTQKTSLTYELDNLKYELDKKKESANEEEAYKYEFSKFFVNTFGNKTGNENNNPKNIFVYEDNTQLQEDKVIGIFKRDKLLGDRGEFSILKGYLELKYKNIIVTYINNNYDIKLNNIILKTSTIVGDDKMQVIAELNADYVFNKNDHYFKNISLKFYDSELYATGEKSYLFGGKELKVNKNINIVDFKTEIDNIISEYFNNNL